MKFCQFQRLIPITFSPARDVSSPPSDRCFCFVSDTSPLVRRSRHRFDSYKQTQRLRSCVWAEPSPGRPVCAYITGPAPPVLSTRRAARLISSKHRGGRVGPAAGASTPPLMDVTVIPDVQLVAITAARRGGGGSWWVLHFSLPIRVKTQSE